MVKKNEPSSSKPFPDCAQVGLFNAVALRSNITERAETEAGALPSSRLCKSAVALLQEPLPDDAAAMSPAKGGEIASNTGTLQSQITYDPTNNGWVNNTLLQFSITTDITIEDGGSKKQHGSFTMRHHKQHYNGCKDKKGREALFNIEIL